MLTRESQLQLLDISRKSIAHGLAQGDPQPVDINNAPDPLRREAASFITLTLAGRLRGCVGSLEAHRPLIEDAAQNAFAAAFRDPRFSPLSKEEFDGLGIQISILSAPEPIQFSSETALLSQLRPGVDGLIIQSGIHRATFLPSVWASFSKPTDFLSHLKQKAGLTATASDEILHAWRYTTQSFKP